MARSNGWAKLSERKNGQVQATLKTNFFALLSKVATFKDSQYSIVFKSDKFLELT
jgi:hypothetical protein